MRKTAGLTILILLVILCGINFANALTRHQPRLPRGLKEWTFMVYLDGDCDLEGRQINAFLMMASVGSTADINIIVQFDRINGHATSYGDWKDCKRFYITTGMTPTADNALYSLGEINMGDPSSLVNFIIWGVNEYPAEKYALILSDHGDNGGVCEDLTGTYDYLSCRELYEAMETVRESTGVIVDLVGLEACLMGAVEVAYHFSEGAKVIVASEEIGFDDWRYDDILSELAAFPAMNSTTLAQEMVYHFMRRYENKPLRERASLSAFNLTIVANNLIPAVDDLADRLSQTLTTHCYDVLTAISATDYAGPPGDFVYAGDLYHFAQNVHTRIPDLQVKMAAQNVMDAITAALIEEWHGSAHPHYHGLSIYLPLSEDAYHSRTRTYSLENFYWIVNTVWDDFLYTLFVTYAPGTRSRESLSDVSYTLFDSNADDYLDAVHVQLDVDTTDEPLNVTVHGRLIDSSNSTVDTSVAWTIASSEDEWCNLYLYAPVGDDGDWYDVELLLYDEYGIREDFLFGDNVAYLPQEMQHDVAVNDISIIKTVVGQGFPAKINVTIGNLGHYPETLNVTTYANGTIIDTTQLVISNGINISYTIHWNTTSQSKGNYTIMSFVEPVEGEAYTVDNTLVANEEICVTIPGDVDGDRDIDVFDVVAMAGAYGSEEGDPTFNANYDIDSDGDIDIFDIVAAAGNYGESW